METEVQIPPGSREVLFPSKLRFLAEPNRYKVIWGGRGKGGSWGFARQALLFGAQRKLRILCARETQQSLTESVHALLDEQIEEMGLRGDYIVQDKKIIGRKTGTEFVFKGLRHDIGEIKSMEGIDIAWVEEAERVSKHSWETFVPTIRKDPSNIYEFPSPSEIWVGFNPKLDTDETYKRFVLSPPVNAKVVKLSYRDNPWFPDILRIEMEGDKCRDPATYQNIWEGECLSAVEGAIYANEIKAAEESGRITQVSHDRTRPVHTFWDLGFGDTMCVWFAQIVNDWYQIIDCMQGNQQPLSYYVTELVRRGMQLGYRYGTDWLPWDGVSARTHHRLGGGDNTKSPDMLLRAAGREVRLAPDIGMMNGIGAVRLAFPRMRFDRDRCADGLQALRHYQMGPDAKSGQERREPLHNWASHFADAMRTLALGIREPEAVAPKSQYTEETEYSPWA